MAETHPTWRDGLRDLSVCILAATLAMSSVGRAQTSQDSSDLFMGVGMLKWLAGNAKRAGRTSVDLGFRGNPFDDRLPQETLGWSSVIVVTPKQLDVLSYVTPNNLVTWHVFHVDDVLVRRQPDAELNVMCAESLPNGLHLSDGDAAVERREGSTVIDGVTIVDPGDGNHFAVGRQYLIVAEMCQDNRRLELLHPSGVFNVLRDGHITRTGLKTKLSEFLIHLGTVKKVRDYLSREHPARS